jgi:hypothetical protein
MDFIDISLHRLWKPNIGFLGTTAVMVHGTRRMKGQENGELHNEELHILYSFPNIRQIKSKRVRWIGHVACMIEERESVQSFDRKVRRKENTWKTEA